jgi:hypothetical protein
VDSDGRPDPIGLAEFEESIDPGAGGYILWFKTMNFRNNLPSLPQLGEMAELEPVLISPIGNIYRIISGSQ